MTPEACRRIEDLYWLVETDAHLVDACTRLQITDSALEKFCDRYGIYPLYQRLKHRAHHCNEQCPNVLPPIPPPPTTLESIMTNDITELIERAQEHPLARIKSAARRADEAIEKLRDLIAAEDAKAQALAEVERLERELAEAKARARGQTVKPAVARVDTKQIRVWAKRKGMDCPTRGRVPQRVIAAYDKAQQRTQRRAS